VQVLQEACRAAAKDTEKPTRVFTVRMGAEAFKQKQAKAAANWKPRSGEVWSRKCKIDLGALPPATVWPETVQMHNFKDYWTWPAFLKALKKDHCASQAKFIVCGKYMFYQAGWKKQALELFVEQATKAPQSSKRAAGSNETDETNETAETNGSEDQGGVVQRQVKKLRLTMHTATIQLMASKKQQSLMELMQKGKAVAFGPEDGSSSNVVWWMVDVATDTKLAVCKPAKDVTSVRDGVPPHAQPYREEVAFFVDSAMGGNIVPVTIVTYMAIDGELVFGSAQKCCLDSLGAVDDFGISSNDVFQAQQFVSQDQAENLAVLDMSLFSLDRGPQNLLVLKGIPTKTLGAIDNGLNLPPWTELAEACFDAWEQWAHFKVPPTSQAIGMVERICANKTHLCEGLRALQIQPESVLTFQITTLFLEIGIVEARGIHTIFSLANKMLKDYDSESSWLQVRVREAAARVNFNNAQVEESCAEFLDCLRVILQGELLPPRVAN